ncbi:helix-turn-helix transcriptional regulator [Amycolatopsis sp. H6(2020)]|nr:helix-turn-helix transcriptional regulator [Amycolatopsis sp. H6(2020)]
MSLRQLARLTDTSPSLLSSWETGERRIPAVPLGWILGLLNLPSAECHLLMRLHAESERASYVERFDPDVVSLQRAYDRYTLHTYEWAPRIVPDLLQTSDYAHALPGSRSTQPDDVDQEIFARRVRQLDRDPRHRHTLLLGSAALTLDAIPLEVLQAQLLEITVPGNRWGVDTRIVPAGAHVAPTIEPFVIYETAEKVLTVVLRHEHSTIYLSDLDTVKRYKATFDALRQKAAAYALAGSS